MHTALTCWSRACCTGSPFLGKSQMGIKPKGPLFLLHDISGTEAFLFTNGKAWHRRPMKKSATGFPWGIWTLCFFHVWFPLWQLPGITLTLIFQLPEFSFKSGTGGKLPCIESLQCMCGRENSIMFRRENTSVCLGGKAPKYWRFEMCMRETSTYLEGKIRKCMFGTESSKVLLTCKKFFIQL